MEKRFSQFAVEKLDWTAQISDLDPIPLFWDEPELEAYPGSRKAFPEERAPPWQRSDGRTMALTLNRPHTYGRVVQASVELGRSKCHSTHK